MDNNKEELKKLESQYNKYMKFIKNDLLIILVAFLIVAIRYIYCFSLAYKLIYANNVYLLNKNCKQTLTHFPGNNPEDTYTITYYFKDGITVMELDWGKQYKINGKYYYFPLNSKEKTYSIENAEHIEQWEDYSFSKKLYAIAVHASSFFTDNIDHEKVDGTKYLIFSWENNKTYYDAKTYLQTRTINANSITDIKYEFDVVTDEDITLPDLSEYTLEED